MTVLHGSNPPVIGDLVAIDQRLEVSCAKCHRDAYLAPAEALRLLGATTTFSEAARRLTCGACGASGSDRTFQWISCRGSIVDYYAWLERHAGQIMPRK